MEDNTVFLTIKVFIFQFCRENSNENKHFKETKTLEIKNVLDHTKDFQGTVGSCTLPSLKGEWLEIKLLY